MANLSSNQHCVYLFFCYILGPKGGEEVDVEGLYIAEAADTQCRFLLSVVEIFTDSCATSLSS